MTGHHHNKLKVYEGQQEKKNKVNFCSHEQRRRREIGKKDRGKKKARQTELADEDE